MADHEQIRRKLLPTIAGAWTQARRNGDKEIRELTKFVMQAGVGAFLAWRLIILLDAVLIRYQDGMVVLAKNIAALNVTVASLDSDVRKALDENARQKR